MYLTTVRVGESVRIGAVTIKLLYVRGRQAKLGIDAPKEVKIERGENKCDLPILEVETGGEGGTE